MLSGKITVSTLVDKFIIRKTGAKDKSAIIELLKKTNAFNHEEVDCAIELLDIYLANPDQKDYDFLSAVTDSDDTVGYICYGKTPLTDAVYDLYWIAVDPDFQGIGIGRRLMNHLEKILKSENARMLLIETSSKSSYAGTQAFYENNDFIELSRIKDFYKENDDRITYGKTYAVKNNFADTNTKLKTYNFHK